MRQLKEVAQNLRRHLKGVTVCTSSHTLGQVQAMAVHCRHEAQGITADVQQAKRCLTAKVSGYSE